MPFRWPRLDPVQQNELLGTITTAVVEALPPGWCRVMIDYRMVGRTVDVAVGVEDTGGTYRRWEPPVDVWKMFQRLRGGMYRDGEGTWFSARFGIEPPTRFTIQYNWRNEPDFDPYPAAEQFAIEQERFPRAEEYMPEWFRQRLVAVGD
ncbi:hypothetical protein [Actinocatenispora comari]|uniref:Uncharacterized protein n=1 Tax=Actinocatenispora comari TaxID=2807577 RepID=A0A8J4A9I6_9ACTN|nr:hypothetical protein [Actinocatenispora comari]GIL25037.1 hypothetical protein NUM_02920 [Actinocatenispora comari]